LYWLYSASGLNDFPPKGTDVAVFCWLKEREREREVMKSLNDYYPENTRV